MPALFRDASALPAPTLAWYAARLPRDGDVLDLACGSGQLLVALAQSGFRMHGIDRSTAALARCRERAAHTGVEATLVRQPLEALNLPFRFAAAYAAGGEFQALTDPRDVASALGRIHAHLLPGGLLLLELCVPSGYAQRLAAPLVELRTAALADGTRITLRSETVTHADARLMHTRNRYVQRRGSQRLAEASEARAFTWYAREDIEERLAAHAFGDVTFEAPATARDDADAYAVRARAR